MLRCNIGVANMKVCFIGHRTVTNIEQIKIKLYETITKLIEKGADTFLFGSKSDFNSLCYAIVTEIQSQFPNIKRICYNVPNEVALTSKEEKQQCERFFSKMLKYEVHFAEYDEAVKSQKSMKANKNAYIMRNQEMIDNSDICVFYYNKDFLPPKRKQFKRSINEYQPKSGTAIAYQYAIAKKKIILNVFD